MRERFSKGAGSRGPQITKPADSPKASLSTSKTYLSSSSVFLPSGRASESLVISSPAFRRPLHEVEKEGGGGPEPLYTFSPLDTAGRPL